jgi:predicted dienelactone hydrolase
MRRTHRAVLAATLAAIAGVGITTGPAAAAPPALPTPQLTLPAPTGRYAVGATELHLTDQSRADPWVPESGPRQLMVSMFYPALLPIGPPRQYLTSQEAALVLTAKGLPGVSPDVLAATRSSAHEGAPPLPSWHGLPLVILTPGAGMPRAILTGLAEDLASKGYVVADIGPNYETYGLAFPDGHVTTCTLACADSTEPTVGLTVRIADTSFVIDQLTGPTPSWSLSWLIDPTRIGLDGDSVGGYAAPHSMLADHRIRAGVNMDGRVWTPLPAAGLDRPFLMLGRESERTPTGADPTWPDTWTHLTGWKRWLTAANFAHASFSDTFVLTDQLGVSQPGVISGVRSMELTRAYIGAFFDLTLRGSPQPLLDGPTAANPEVKFWP